MSLLSNHPRKINTIYCVAERSESFRRKPSKKRCMKGPTCNWKLKTGKCCNKNAIECASGIFCDKHKLLHAAAVNKTVEKDEIMPWTAEMTEMLKAKSVIELKKQLRSVGLTIGGNKRTLIQRIFKNNK